MHHSVHREIIDSACRGAMFKLPEDRVEVPVAEASQTYCPHWILTVLHQFVREFSYMSIAAGIKVQRAMCSCMNSSPAPPRRIIGKSGEGRALHANQKRVLFIRHGQGAHNASIQNWGHIDPELNEAGEQQVAALNERMRPYVGDIELVAVSPLTRALQTATGGLAGTSAKWCVLPLLRERLGAPCDTGRTRTELLRCFPEMESWEGMDELAEVWWSTSTEYDLHERVEKLVEWIHSRDVSHTQALARARARPLPRARAAKVDYRLRTPELSVWMPRARAQEKVIAVVGHGGLFTRVLGFYLKNCGHQWVDWSAKASDELV